MQIDAHLSFASNISDFSEVAVSCVTVLGFLLNELNELNRLAILIFEVCVFRLAGISLSSFLRILLQTRLNALLNCLLQKL